MRHNHNDSDNAKKSKLRLGPQLKSATASLMEQLPEPWNGEGFRAFDMAELQAWVP